MRQAETRAKRNKLAKQPAAPAKKPNEMRNKLQAGETPQQGNARLAVDGLGANGAATWEWSDYPYGESEKRIDLTEVVNRIVDTAERVNRGDLGDQEAILAAQVVTLNAMFANLAHRSRTSTYFDHADRYMRLAFKAQAQCRATVETLAAIKNPGVVFAKQANIANGPQQVNNGAMPSRAANLESGRSELLEAPSERLDLGAAGKASASNQALATLGKRNRSEND